MLSLGERRALRVDVRESLTQAIARGHFKPGERIVESRVARELGVSQATIREALRELEATGLVDYSTNRGCVVRKLERSDIDEMYEMRALLEGEAAGRAAGRLTPADVAELDALVDEMVELAQAGETTAMIERDVHFHRLICEAADHRLLLRLWLAINPAIWTQLAVLGVLRLPPEMIAQRHRAVVDALRSGDPAVARAVMANHLLELSELADGNLDE
jgi:DNA-binding GntR family transcriptional regulator